MPELLRSFIYLILFFALFSGCNDTSFGQKADSLFLVNQEASYYYDLKRPDEKYFLPYVLSEISGLTHIGDEKVACVEDEGGRVYFYDLKKREIYHAIRFWRPGDFEGVEVVDDQVYVLESDGDIFHFAMTEEKEVRAEKIETPLTRRNDTEGFGYDPATKSLLIACKEDEDVDGNNAKGKAVYAFSLEDKELDTDPVFEVRMKKLRSFYEENKNGKYDEEKLKFEPSAIAYHPIEKTFYLLASVGKLLLVLDQDGKLKYSYPIAPRVLNQPEGICFAPNGDLYISSEGEGDRGYILKFKMKQR